MKPIDPSLATYQQELAAAIDDLVRMLEVIYEGFIRHRKSLLDEAGAIGKKVHTFEKDFAERILRETGKEGVKLLLSLGGHVERIDYSMEAVIRTVLVKIEQGTLFSDKAVTELKYVFESTKDLLRNIKDVVLTGNPVLLQHVVSTGEALGKVAADFSTQHEERLVAGVCQPNHSSIYLDIMDNLRTSGWHVREMATKIGA